MTDAGVVVDPDQTSSLTKDLCLEMQDATKNRISLLATCQHYGVDAEIFCTKFDIGDLTALLKVVNYPNATII